MAEPIQETLIKKVDAANFLLEDLNTTVLTDASSTYTTTVDTLASKDILVDIVATKGCTVVVTPVLNTDGTAIEGTDSDTGTVADGGSSGRFVYSDFGSPRAKVVVTKTELGDMTSFSLSIRGRR